MMEHQRYFPVRGADGALLPHFLVVSDRGPEHEALIRAGNERVLRARLADAQFFDQQDRKMRLSDRVEALRGVAFLKGLGNYFDKTLRLEKLAAEVAARLGLSERGPPQRRPRRAALQGGPADGNGRRIPRAAGRGRPPLRPARRRAGAGGRGHRRALPAALGGRPAARDAGRARAEPRRETGQPVSCFAAGLIPTGSADPYALRRQSQGILRIIEASRPALRAFAAGPRRAATAAGAALPRGGGRAEGDGVPQGPPLPDGARPRRAARPDPRRARAGLRRRLRLLGAAPGAAGARGEPCWQDLVISVERTYNISKALHGGRRSGAGAVLRGARKGPLVALRGAPRRDRAAPGRARATRRPASCTRKSSPRRCTSSSRRCSSTSRTQRVRDNRLMLLRRINRLFSAKFADLSQIVTGVQK